MKSSAARHVCRRDAWFMHACAQFKFIRDAENTCTACGFHSVKVNVDIRPEKDPAVQQPWTQTYDRRGPCTSGFRQALELVSVFCCFTFQFFCDIESHLSSPPPISSITTTNNAGKGETIGKILTSVICKTEWCCAKTYGNEE